METLVLNASYEPIRVINWERAMYYLFTEKADLVTTYANKIVRSAYEVFKVPKVIKLRKYVKLLSNLTNVKYSRKGILKRDKLMCQYCGKKCSNKTATLDHIIPKSRGGKNNWTNIVTACFKCNGMKGDRTPREASMKLLSKPKRPNIRKFLDKFNLDFI